MTSVELAHEIVRVRKLLAESKDRHTQYQNKKYLERLIQRYKNYGKEGV